MKELPSFENSSDRGDPDRVPLIRRASEQQQWYHLKHVDLRTVIPWILHLLLFSASGAMLLAAIALRDSDPHVPSLDYGYRHLGITNNNLKSTRFHGNIFNQSSPFRGPPSPVVDEAWDKLWDVAPMSISEDIFQQLNASKYAVEVPTDLGGGRMAIFEITHQIHCLQTLWQNTYPEYYISSVNFSQEHPEDWHQHMDHCADIILQKLLCDANTGLITYNWLENHLFPHPNFNVQHQCRDFDAVVQYGLDHGINYSKLPQGQLLRPTDRPYVDFKELPFDPNAEE